LLQQLQQHNLHRSFPSSSSSSVLYRRGGGGDDDDGGAAASSEDDEYVDSDDTDEQEATMGSKNNQQQRQPQGAKKKNRKALVSMWDEKAKKAAAQQKRNVFSKDYDSSTHAKGKNKPGQKGYGKAPEGSKSAARAAKAKLWVKQQIGQLISVIKKIGSQSSQGRYEVTFGIIFVAYQDISDTLVGILRRARKYGCVEFEGDMLYDCC